MNQALKREAKAVKNTFNVLLCVPTSPVSLCCVFGSPECDAVAVIQKSYWREHDSLFRTWNDCLNMLLQSISSGCFEHLIYISHILYFFFCLPIYLNFPFKTRSVTIIDHLLTIQNFLELPGPSVCCWINCNKTHECKAYYRVVGDESRWWTKGTLQRKNSCLEYSFS